VVENDLKGALEELHLALDEDEVARLEGAEQLLAGVPQASADAACAVAQLELEEQVAVAVGPELLVGGEVDLLDIVAVGELLHETSRGGDGWGSHERRHLESGCPRPLRGPGASLGKKRWCYYIRRPASVKAPWPVAPLSGTRRRIQ